MKSSQFSTPNKSDEKSKFLFVARIKGSKKKFTALGQINEERLKNCWRFINQNYN